MRWGYLDEVVEETTKEGQIILVAFYSDQDGGEVGQREYDVGDTIPEMWDF